MRSEPEFRAAVRAFVAHHTDDLSIDEAIGDGTPLFTLRILRSIHLPELIILLERLRGAPIDVERLAHGDFASIEVIVQRFGTTS
jgi:hypothetical protein